MIVVAISETTKSFSGDLRPDFLARCQPAPPEGSPPGGRVSNHISDTAVPLSAVHLGDIASCTNPNLDTVRQGRFVSIGMRHWQRHGLGACHIMLRRLIPTAEALMGARSMLLLLLSAMLVVTTTVGYACSCMSVCVTSSD